MKRLPLIAPNPAPLSAMADQLRAIEASGVFSNAGPVVRGFEADLTRDLFGGTGECLAVANATLGLMMAIRHVAGGSPGDRRMALMPALTFAATAHAALWAGLAPLVCDIDPADWSARADEEERLLRAHGDRIAVIVPYAAFGDAIDLDRYRWLSRRFGVGVVIDAAASLGTRDEAGIGFGTGCEFTIIFSMHATKTFATAEGGVIYSANHDLMTALRAMNNFGFGAERSATMWGINAKLPEVSGLLASAKLAEIEAVCEHRATLERTYRSALGDGFGLQRSRARRQSMQFMPVLLPRHLAPHRRRIIDALAADGIGAGHYFSPHLGQQPFFMREGRIEPTPVADDVGARILSLPITDAMTTDDAAFVCDRLVAACARTYATPAHRRGGEILGTVIVGGGPAGTALLVAASKQGRLANLAAGGLAILERDAAIGGGRLAHYAITSDSTAETFLSAVKDNPCPELAALIAHDSARTIARYTDALGVPLNHMGPYLRVIGDRLAAIVTREGGSVLSGHEALSATRLAGGLWRTRVRRAADGSETDLLSRNIVIATGGHQPIERLPRERVAGASLLDRCGGRLIQSDTVLALGGLAEVQDLLTGQKAPRIAVIGGSTSALAVANLLLKRADLPLGAGAITLLHRRPLRPFYPSAEAARADAFDDFGPADICPASGFVYRLGGFRLEARDLVQRMLGINGRVPDPRLALMRFSDQNDPAALAVLDQADLVIAALGYRPRALPLFEDDGSPIALNADGPGRPPLVDRECRVIDRDERPIPGLYGIGLSAGFVPSGALGGEASFSGQANGLWLWQNGVGMMIVDQLLRPAERAVA
jgi:dTDP-4-amino-4,6-dideoxygalactose transaminase